MPSADRTATPVAPTAAHTAATASPADVARGTRGLDAVFRPRSIAVIGASRERGAVGAEIFHNLISHGFQGVVYPVNPKAGVVQSVQAYPTIEAVPGPVDLAIIVVPAVAALRAAGARSGSEAGALGSPGSCSSVSR